MKIDLHYRAEHVLPGGTPVTIRLLRAADRDELVRGFSRLSPASRYMRFLSHTHVLSEPMLQRLMQTDGVNHVAIVAVTDSLDLKSDVGIGVARFIRLEGEPTVAEAAVTVVDDMQGKGVGRMLLRVLSEAAQERGIGTFRAEILRSNRPMRKILADVGAIIRRDDGETLLFDIPLDRPGEIESRRDHPLRRILRLAAESIGWLDGAGGRES